MASVVFTDGSLTINSVDLSAFVRSASLNYEEEAVENSTMSSRARSYVAGGPTTWSLSVTLTQDFAASATDATIDAIVVAGAAVPMIFLPTSAAVSATNPSYTGNVLLTGYPIMDGGWGELLESGVTFQGTGTLTRNVV